MKKLNAEVKNANIEDLKENIKNAYISSDDIGLYFQTIKEFTGKVGKDACNEVFKEINFTWY